MNERIEEFLKQYHREDYFDSYGKITTDPHYLMYHEEVQLLIELIVRECALTAGLMEYQGRKGIGAMILDNYGIKNEKV